MLSTECVTFLSSSIKLIQFKGRNIGLVFYFCLTTGAYKKNVSESASWSSSAATSRTQRGHQKQNQSGVHVRVARHLSRLLPKTCPFN